MTQPSPRPSRKTSARTAGASRPRLPKPVRMAVDAAMGKKGLDVVVLDLRKSDAFTDFFVIATGASPRQVHAIADGVEMALKGANVRPSNVEGSKRAEWVLLDYFDFVVHVFSPSARAFSGLAGLGATARRFSIDAAAAES